MKAAVKRFSLDAAVAVAWRFEDESTPLTEAILDLLSGAEGVVPGIWPLEVANTPETMFPNPWSHEIQLAGGGACGSASSESVLLQIALALIEPHGET